MQKPDFSFVREGRPLHEWLVVSPDPKVRQAAGDAASAMFFGVPSVHTDVEEIEGGMPTGVDHQSAWRGAVREAVERPDFPRRMAAPTRAFAARSRRSGRRRPEQCPGWWRSCGASSPLTRAPK